ncbi:Energy-coupling factor transporter transmembrane protein EcfT [Paenibacillus plantiphilus]|uniref:Energy-coupling factor transporter transmembrane protein EcfT n=1 Tax=Paenibacillus plantiphilus TaxID=2905650 RepID=A0ABN8G935_9BACL|nr:energy-coupling factor transporter transmembrane component T [Paenibacillus plantiphilus]CAH1200594.1 Energy-coupling factor transporter transmembrane protein EcfT [Paenibacillus plantiphilus]
MKDHFSTFHPIVNFGYFAAILIFSMVFMHPVFQCIALVSAVVYSIMLKGRGAVRFNLLYMVPLLLLTAAMNPAFNHEGVTILFYLSNGNPITLESILFGAAAACMFVTIIIWFSCYNAVMTSDKFIYIFGKIWPALSLIFSMALRFVPRYLTQIRIISGAQKCIGRDVTQGNIWRRARNGIAIVSIMTTWALENAIETADSMKSRGYGLPNRSSFSIFRFDSRDMIVSAAMLGCMSVVLIGAAMGENTIRFFPSVKMIELTPFSVVVYGSYLMLCMMPVIITMVEEIKWKRIESRS